MKLSTVFLQLACAIHVHVSGLAQIKGTQYNPCMERLEVGPCRAWKPRWYYDIYSQMCRAFTYGGCKGNNNNFLTEADCKRKCYAFQPNETNVCTEKPLTGPCRAYIPSWFFDAIHNVCKMFIYGGCQGNGNRFASELECQASCMGTSGDRGTCSLDPVMRSCNARAQLWYFDPEDNICRRFPPGFCGNSANKFATCRKCMRRCSSSNVSKACSLAYKKIHYAQRGISWPGETEPRVRGPGASTPFFPGAPKPTLGISGQAGPLREGQGLLGGQVIPGYSGPAVPASMPTSSQLNTVKEPAKASSSLQPASPGGNLRANSIIPNTKGSPFPRQVGPETNEIETGLPVDTFPGPTRGGPDLGVHVERGSSLKTPPLTIPANFLTGFKRPSLT